MRSISNARVGDKPTERRADTPRRPNHDLAFYDIIIIVNGIKQVRHTTANTIWVHIFSTQDPTYLLYEW